MNLYLQYKIYKLTRHYKWEYMPAFAKSININFLNLEIENYNQQQDIYSKGKVEKFSVYTYKSQISNPIGFNVKLTDLIQIKNTFWNNYQKNFNLTTNVLNDFFSNLLKEYYNINTANYLINL